VATLGELATMLDVSVKALRLAFDREPHGRIRFVRRKPARETLYAVSDVRALVESQRTWFDERRRQAQELEATQRAARVERRETNVAKSEARHKARAARAGAPPSRPDVRGRSGPEVVVRPGTTRRDRG
jgi:hypothetical protein